jgi:hypothetical protein
MVYRNEIEKALDETISDEAGMKVQGASPSFLPSRSGRN